MNKIIEAINAALLKLDRTQAHVATAQSWDGAMVFILEQGKSYLCMLDNADELLLKLEAEVQKQENKAKQDMYRAMDNLNEIKMGYEGPVVYRR